MVFYTKSIKFLVECRMNILKEVKVLEKLKEKGIIRLKNAFLLDSNLIIIMEYASGGELKEYVSKKTRLEEEEARQIFVQILHTMQHCHTLGIIHRDLKLENVLFADESHTNIKVVDFGIAGLIKDEFAEKSKAGSLKYMAPEILSEKNIEARPSIDIWSMGCMLYAMTCGELPFTGKNPTEVINKIKLGIFEFPKTIKLSYYLRDLITKMLNMDYNSRITIKEIWEHAWIEGSSPGSSPVKQQKTEDFTSVKPLTVKLDMQDPIMEKRNERIFLMGTRGRCPTGYKPDKHNRKGTNFCLPTIGKNTIPARKVMKRGSMENCSTFAPAGKDRNLRKSILSNMPLSEKMEPENVAKLWILNEYENTPSFMKPIHRTKEEKQLIISLQKEAKDNPILRKLSLNKKPTRVKARSSSRCNIVRKDSNNLKMVLQ